MIDLLLANGRTTPLSQKIYDISPNRVLETPPVLTTLYLRLSTVRRWRFMIAETHQVRFWTLQCIHLLGAEQGMFAVKKE